MLAVGPSLYCGDVLANSSLAAPVFQQPNGAPVAGNRSAGGALLQRPVGQAANTTGLGKGRCAMTVAYM